MAVAERDVSFVIWQLLLWLSFFGVCVWWCLNLISCHPLIIAAPVFPDICKGQWGAGHGRWQCVNPSRPSSCIQCAVMPFAFASVSLMRTSNNTEDNGPFIYCAMPSSDSPGFLKPLLNLLSLLLAVWLQVPVPASWIQNSSHTLHLFIQWISCLKGKDL